MDLVSRFAVRRIAIAALLTAAPFAGAEAQDAVKLWSDPATWQGSVPDGKTDAVIPAGEVVFLDTDAVVRNLQIDGELHCLDDRDLSLTAERIMVHGLFQCGSPESPFLRQMTLTLTGGVTVPNDPAAMGDRVLGAMHGGAIELHGEPRVAWTQLAATAAAGATDLELTATVDWRVGDRIVLAPTRELWNESEVVTVKAVLGPKKIRVSPALQVRHWGDAHTYSNGTLRWTLDERGEVGLLSRNLKIQGAADAETTGLGGHLMVMAGSTFHGSGIELYRMGQKGLLGRYPFHWHLLGDAPGQFLIGSSIHRSFNRCVTVHGTNDTRVADNVCYDFIGHGYFLEDGGERRNVFDHNLGIGAKKPLRGEAVPDPDLGNSDSRSDAASNGPAVFWISNPQNTLRNNAAAGSQGTGFWYHLSDEVGEPSRTALGMTAFHPRTARFGTFENNRVHSSRQGFSSCTHGGGTFGMEPPDEALIQGLTVSNTEQGVWPCSPPHDRETHRFVDLIVANSPNGFQAPNPMKIENSLFVAYSDNAPPAAAYGGGIDWRAIQVYDQGFHLEGVHFVHYDRPAATVFFPGSGAHKLAKNRGSGLTFDSSPHLFLDPEDFSRPGASADLWGDIVHDLDGSLVGAGFAVVSDHPLMSDGRCIKPLSPIIAGYACPLRYGSFRGEHFSDLPAVTLMRSDGTHSTSDPLGERSLAELILTGGYQYTWRYAQGLAHAKIELHLRDAFPGDTLIYELLDVPAGFSVGPGDGFTATWSEAADLSSLLTGPGHRYYYRDHSLFLKMLASGPEWQALDVVRVCPGGSCTAAPAVGTLPAVAITAPADGARVPAGSPVTFTASVSDPDGIQSAGLYLGTRLAGRLTAPPFTWTLPALAPGRYAVKLVALDSTGQTFTVVQQLFVGEPGPRVEITTLGEGDSVDAGTPFSLGFALFNWVPTPGGEHLRLLVDDQDAGAFFTSGPLPVPALAPGKHEVEVALARPDGTVTAISDRRTIYAMAIDPASGDKTLADFEDGDDLRARLTADDADIGPVSKVHFAWGTAAPLASRADGQDDLNYFDIANNGLPYGTASYQLALAPPQSWVGYARLELVAAGNLPFDVLVVDAEQGETLLGQVGGVSTVAFNLPGDPTRIDRVVGIRLRYHERSLPLQPSAPALPVFSNSGLFEVRLRR